MGEGRGGVVDKDGKVLSRCFARLLFFFAAVLGLFICSYATSRVRVKSKPTKSFEPGLMC